MTLRFIINKFDGISEYDQDNKRIHSDIVHFFNEETLRMEGSVSIVKIDDDLIDLYCETCHSFDCVHTFKAWRSRDVLDILSKFTKNKYKLAIKGRY